MLRVNYLGDLGIEILCEHSKNVFLSFKNSFSFSHNKTGKGQNMRQFLKVVLKYAVLFYFFLIFRIEDHFSEKQKQSKHPTAEPWPAIFPNLKPCSSAMRM